MGEADTTLNFGDLENELRIAIESEHQMWDGTWTGTTTRQNKKATISLEPKPPFSRQSAVEQGQHQSHSLKVCSQIGLRSFAF